MDVDITLTGRPHHLANEKRSRAARDESGLSAEIRRGASAGPSSSPGVVGDRATASFENGLLTLRIPKAEEVKPKQIKISATSDGQAQRDLVGAGSAR